MIFYGRQFGSLQKKNYMNKTPSTNFKNMFLKEKKVEKMKKTHLKRTYEKRSNFDPFTSP
jgi:hypothetical protein